jgi:hypothetical protein
MFHNFLLTLKGQQGDRLFNTNPPSFMHLSVMVFDLPRLVFHEKKVNLLVKANALPVYRTVKPVLNLFEGLQKRCPRASFLMYFSQCRLLKRFTLINQAFGKLPAKRIADGD